MSCSATLIKSSSDNEAPLHCFINYRLAQLKAFKEEIGQNIIFKEQEQQQRKTGRCKKERREGRVPKIFLQIMRGSLIIGG